MRCGAWIAIGVAVLIAAASQAGATPAAGGRELTAVDAEAFVDGLMPYALKRGDVAGAVVVVVKDGEVLLAKGYGYADVAKQTPVDPSRTLFRPGSVSKLVTWTAVMQLVEAGRLDLDRDINDYLDFRIPPRAGRPVTLRDLMTHSAGFEEGVRNMWSRDAAGLQSNEAWLKVWVPKRIYPSGETPAYSNYGAALAGYIVERVSGRPFEDYVRAEIFRPLEMTTATFVQSPPPGVSQGYMLASGRAWRFERLAPAPAGGMSASGRDMAHFMIAHLQDGRYGGARILQAQTAQRMHGEARRLMAPLNGMLLGFYETQRNGRRIIGHGGDSQAFHSDLKLFLDDGVGLYVALNSAGRPGAARTIRNALFEQFADRYFPGPPLREPVLPTARAHAAMLAGTYENSRRAETTLLSIGTLFSQLRISVTPDGSLVADGFRGPNDQPKVWREVAPFVWREVGGQERLAAKVEGRKVVAVSTDPISPFMVYQPAPWWRSAAWLVPALIAGLAVMAATVLAWPTAAVLGRGRGVATARPRNAVAARLAVRCWAAATLAVAIGWALVLDGAVRDLAEFSTPLDPWLAVLEIGGAVVVAGPLIALWALFATWRSGWRRRAWAMLLVLAAVPAAWVVLVFRLVGAGPNY